MPGGTLPFQSGPVEQVDGGLATRGPGAGTVEDRHPQVDHGKEEVMLTHVGVTKHLRLVDVDPGYRIERICVRRRDAAVIRWGKAPDIDELPHGRLHALTLVTFVICTRVTSVVISE